MQLESKRDHTSFITSTSQSSFLIPEGIKVKVHLLFDRAAVRLQEKKGESWRV